MYANVCHSMTHVSAYHQTHYWGLNNFKQSQLDNNRKDILYALKVLGEAQVEQLYTFLRKRNQDESQIRYENGKITGNEKKQFIKEKTMSKRTIHRSLDDFTRKGLVKHVGYKYHLVDKVKNDMRYWFREFGDSLLYRLMHSYFPYMFKFEENIDELIKLFGTYMVYCLVEASRPPTGDSNKKLSKTDMLNRDKLVASWINDVFNPRRILEYFVAIMNNLSEDDINQKIPNETSINDNHEHISTKKICQRGTRVDGNRMNFSNKNAYDILSERWMTFLLTSEELSFYDIAKKPYYELNVGMINKIMQVLEKKYNIYYKDIILMTKNMDSILLGHIIQSKEQFISKQRLRNISTDPSKILRSRIQKRKQQN
jgi:hypothetical protein